MFWIWRDRSGDSGREHFLETKELTVAKTYRAVQVSKPGRL